MNFFSKFFKKSSSKEDPKKSESKFLPKKKAVIEERFILKFIENGGKFLYCEDLDEVQDNFNLILKENEWVNDDILIINSDLKKTYNVKNKEEAYYRKLFEELFPGRGHIVKRWIPQTEWEGVSYDPSGRAQSVHVSNT